MRWHNALCQTTTFLPWTAFTPIVHSTAQTLSKLSPHLTHLLATTSIPLLTTAETLLLLLHHHPVPSLSHMSTITSAHFNPIIPNLPAPPVHDSLTPCLSVSHTPSSLPVAHVVSPEKRFPRADKSFWTSPSATEHDTAAEMQFVFEHVTSNSAVASHFARAVTAALLSLSGCAVALMPEGGVVCLRLARGKAEHNGIAVRVSRLFRGWNAACAVAGLLCAALGTESWGFKSRVAMWRVAEICEREEGWDSGSNLVRAGGEVLGAYQGVVGIAAKKGMLVCWNGEREEEKEIVRDILEWMVDEGFGSRAGEVVVVEHGRVEKVRAALQDGFGMG